MIIHLSCTTVQQPSPKMARRLSNDSTAVTLHYQIKSASLRLMSTNSTNCTAAQEQQQQQQRLQQQQVAALTGTATAPTGPGITAQAGMPTSWRGTARSPAINVAAVTMRGTHPAVLTGPGITAQEGMPTSWQGTAPGPAISAELPIFKTFETFITILKIQNSHFSINSNNFIRKWAQIS